MYIHYKYIYIYIYIYIFLKISKTAFDIHVGRPF